MSLLPIKPGPVSDRAVRIYHGVTIFALCAVAGYLVAAAYSHFTGS